MDSTTNQPSGSSSSNDVAEPSSALSALQAKIFSAFDSLVQYSTTLKAKFGGEADPRMIRFTSDVAAHLPTSLETSKMLGEFTPLIVVRLVAECDLATSFTRISTCLLREYLLVFLSNVCSLTRTDPSGIYKLYFIQPLRMPTTTTARTPGHWPTNFKECSVFSQARQCITLCLRHLLRCQRAASSIPTTFFPTPRKNALRRSYAVNDIYDPGKAKDSAQGTNAPPADAGDLNEDDDAEAVAQALSAFDTPDEDYYAAGSKTAKGKGEARAKSVERRDDEDTAGPSVARAARARPRSKVAHAAAEGSGLRSTRRGPSDASQAQAGNLPRVPLTLPTGVVSNGLTPSMKNLTLKSFGKANGTPPAGRGTKRRAQEDADADEDEDEDDDAAEASPKKKAKRTAAKKPVLRGAPRASDDSSHRSYLSD
ncbi:hypothetical protein IMY05_C4881000100 [Salix suchowensis]|nr:hypothetical protein IMY05_C4881000100 [Salix suchowensis]